MMASTRSVSVDTDEIMRNILVIRGQRVLLDSDLAALYQVATKALTRAVRRNPGRFPADFTASLRSQSGALKPGRGKHRKYAPYVFTEQGIAMLSSVLTSERAVQVNIEIVRAFIRLRQAVSTRQDLAHKLVALENKYDRQFKVVFDAIRSLMKEPEPKRPGNRFHGKDQRIGIADEIPTYWSSARAECDAIPSLRGEIAALSAYRRLEGARWRRTPTKPCVASQSGPMPANAASGPSAHSRFADVGWHWLWFHTQSDLYER